MVDQRGRVDREGGSKAQWISETLSESPPQYPKIHGLLGSTPKKKATGRSRARAVPPPPSRPGSGARPTWPRLRFSPARAISRRRLGSSFPRPAPGRPSYGLPIICRHLRRLLAEDHSITPSARAVDHGRPRPRSTVVRPSGRRRRRPRSANPVYWGAWIGPQFTGNEAPWDMSAVSKMERGSARKACRWSSSRRRSPPANSTCGQSGIPHSRHELDPQARLDSRPELGLPGDLVSRRRTMMPEYALSRIADGNYDSYISNVCRAAQKPGATPSSCASTGR